MLDVTLAAGQFSPVAKDIAKLRRVHSEHYQHCGV